LGGKYGGVGKGSEGMQMEQRYPGPQTKICGVIGDPIGHSLSPRMQNAAFAALGLDYLYLPFQVPPARLAEAIAGVRGLGLLGLNVTIPHKQAVIKYLDRLSPEAELIGAVNTIHNTGSELIGYNTDGRGFVAALRQEAQVEPDGQRVVVLGAGGAARAVAIQLALAGVQQIIIICQELTEGTQIAHTINHKVGCCHACALRWTADNISEALAQAGILINATPVGMIPYPDNSPVPASYLHKHLLVCDLVYNPRETQLLQAAQANGARTLSGLGMLVHQGALAFTIWTGRQAPVEVMYQALNCCT